MFYFFVSHLYLNSDFMDSLLSLSREQGVLCSLCSLAPRNYSLTVHRTLCGALFSLQIPDGHVSNPTFCSVATDEIDYSLILFLRLNAMIPTAKTAKRTIIHGSPIGYSFDCSPTSVPPPNLRICPL